MVTQYVHVTASLAKKWGIYVYRAFARDNFPFRSICDGAHFDTEWMNVFESADVRGHCEWWAHINGTHARCGKGSTTSINNHHREDYTYSRLTNLFLTNTNTIRHIVFGPTQQFEHALQNTSHDAVEVGQNLNDEWAGASTISN